MMKLAYLCDVFGKRNDLNLQLLHRDKHIPHLADKISSLHRKLEMWYKGLERGNTESFENMSEFVESSDLNATIVIPCLKEHVSLMKGFLQKYLPDNSAQYGWVRDPCWFQLSWGGTVHQDDIWLLRETKVCITVTKQFLDCCGEETSTHSLKTKYRSKLNIECQ